MICIIYYNKMENTPIIEKMKADHPDYKKIHSRGQYTKFGALKTVCSRCNATVSNKAMIVHRRTERCINHDVFWDERYRTLLEELKTMLKLKGKTLSNLIDDSQA
jgi:hypothetical protein